MTCFRVIEHKVPCQYIREYPGALSGEQEDTLYLAVKQYVPLDNPHPQRNDVTIIAAPGNAFPKELYEPFWEDLLRAAKSRNFRIRSIWMADAANQGASGVLNEDRLGNEPSLADYARDILHLINVKRAEMPRPIIGIGHSMGGQYL
jgi:pimeloyl-ACP methyl ester carboxylesterase